jgi:DNA polymerase-4
MPVVMGRYLGEIDSARATVERVIKKLASKQERLAGPMERVLEAVGTCLPVEKVLSIDEMAGRLVGRQRDVATARELAGKVKQALRERVGECLTCSIGIAPNLFLGKLASDMQKPNGLVALTKADLPAALLGLELQNICGIGERMEERLRHAGITTIAELWQASRLRLRKAWGGITGALFYEMLHGADLLPPSSPHAKSMSHQHVLEPALRTAEGARDFSHHLLTKAAERLPRGDYYCRRLALHLSWVGDFGPWHDEVSFHETRDTGFLLARLAILWANVPKLKPLAVGVALLDLVPASKHQFDLFADNPRRQKLSPLVDGINGRYGRYAVSFGLPPEKVRKFRGHAAFQRVPGIWEF